MAKKKPQTSYFKTILDMQAIPADKVDLFCEDLRLWLRLHRMADEAGIPVTTPRNVFGWIDDGRHNARIDVTIKQ